MKQLVLILTTLCLLLTTKVSAQEEIPTYRLPEGQRFGELHCFNLGEYQELLRIDTELHVAVGNIDRLERLVLLRERAIVQLELALDAANDQVDELTLERDHVRGMWEEENRLRHQAEASPDTGGMVATAVAIVSTAVAIALGITIAVQ